MTEVLVVGAGAVGLAVAESLSARGVSVSVAEAGRCGAGASAGNAGWITPSLSIPVPGPGVIATSLKWLLDPSGPLWIRPTLSATMLGWVAAFMRSCRREPYRRGLAVLQALAAQAGPAFERLAGRQVAFELHRTPLLYPAFTDRELDHLTRVAGELREAGASAPVDRLTGAELAELEPALDRSRLLGGLRADGELRVRPESLTAGLRTSLEARGARVRDHAPVRGLRRDGTGWLALGPDGEYRAEAVVVAAGVGSRALLGRLGLRLPIAATKGYSRTYAPDPGLPRRPVYLEDPKVSVSVFDGGVRVSGTLELGARRLTLSPRRLEAITSATRAAFPRWKPRESPVDWAGMRSLSPDGLPYVGAIPGHPGLYVATAHATLGITLAPLTAELLADCLLGDRPDPLISALDPARALRTRQPRHTEGAPS